MPELEVLCRLAQTENKQLWGRNIENWSYTEYTEEKEIVQIIYLNTSPVVFAYVYPFSDIHVTPRISSLLQPSSSQHRVDGDTEVRLFKVRMLLS